MLAALHRCFSLGYRFPFYHCHLILLCNKNKSYVHIRGGHSPLFSSSENSNQLIVVHELIPWSTGKLTNDYKELNYLILYYYYYYYCNTIILLLYFSNTMTFASGDSSQLEALYTVHTKILEKKQSNNQCLRAALGDSGEEELPFNRKRPLTELLDVRRILNLFLDPVKRSWCGRNTVFLEAV